MRRFTDEELMAYADGELPAEQARTVEAAARTDAALARRIDVFAGTRRALQSAFADVASAPPPRRLLDALGAAPAPRRRWTVPASLAATLLAGVFGAWLVLRPGAQPGVSDALVAKVLETQPSGVPLTDAGREAIAVATYRAGDAYCRAYEMRDAAGTTRGLACRDARGTWQSQVTPPGDTESSDPGGDYRTAGRDAAAPAPGTQVPPNEEQALIDRHWQ